ncbi:MAG: D-alanyl-lipoteichoic acid biosynthesis protein DltD [Eubacteriaceae bacterium]|nr:D-alanyl-lipoteichoic acid biosynthesis protein DltD [Eubacteriaceae bacterium]
MKKIAAFLTALIMFTAVVAGMHVYGVKQINTRTSQMGTWNNLYKYASHDAVASNLDNKTILTFGSSEFNHSVKTPFYPKKVFKDQDVTPMIMGSAFSQSLTHTIALGGLERSMKKRKVVLIVSPQWFNKEGVRPEAFALRFSESDYTAMLQNSRLSFSLRKSIADRTEKLLSKDATLKARVKKYNKVYLYKRGNPWDKISCRMRGLFVSEKDRLCVLTAMRSSRIKKGSEKAISGESPDWKLLEGEADQYEKKRSTNQFYMRDKTFRKKILRIMKKKKDSDKGRSYGSSPEYDDLKIFLELCRERNIEPLLILPPVNGYWYDYTGFPKEGREAFYKKTAALAEEYGAKTADLSKYEYTPYFMQDAVHYSGKGWVKVNEEIYKFSKENN